MQILILNDLNRGNTLKQGDKTVLRYQIADADSDLPSKVGQTATIYFMQGNDEYYKTTTTVKSNNIVEFSVNQILPVGKYNVHVVVGNQVFPSDNLDKFTVTQSPLGKDVNVVKVLGVDAVVDKALEGLNVSIPKEVRDQVAALIKTETDKLKDLQTQSQTELTKLTSHTGDYNNPHRVTKAQVGLGNVLNYGIATQSEAETGTSNAKYMTPLRTKQAISKGRPTITTRYATSDTALIRPTVWTVSPPQHMAGKYFWTEMEIKYPDGSSSKQYSMSYVPVTSFETSVNSNTKIHTITHNLGTLSPIVSAYMDNQEFLLWTVEVLDLNRIRVGLGSQIPNGKTIRIGVR